MAIVQLLDSSRVPLTLHQIHEQAGDQACDFATVFRFVSILEEKGLVEKVAWMDGTTRHELRAGDGHHHHYLICRTCHKVEPVDECVVERLEEEIAAERGYTAINHSLQLSGVCPSCQKTSAAEKKKRAEAESRATGSFPCSAFSPTGWAASARSRFRCWERR